MPSTLLKSFSGLAGEVGAESASAQPLEKQQLLALLLRWVGE